MTRCSRGDVVLISLVFTDGTGVKKRPAVIISSDLYHRQRQETIISAITSRVDQVRVGDHLLNDWREAGLLLPSVATGIIRTIKQNMIVRKLGKTSEDDLKGIYKQLSIALEMV